MRWPTMAQVGKISSRLLRWSATAPQEPSAQVAVWVQEYRYHRAGYPFQVKLFFRTFPWYFPKVKEVWYMYDVLVLLREILYCYKTKVCFRKSLLLLAVRDNTTSAADHHLPPNHHLADIVSHSSVTCPPPPLPKTYTHLPDIVLTGFQVSLPSNNVPHCPTQFALSSSQESKNIYCRKLGKHRKHDLHWLAMIW